MSELKPCPFCGGKATVQTRKDKEAGQTFYGCMCKNTGCCRIPALYMTQAQAIEVWNKRVGEQNDYRRSY